MRRITTILLLTFVYGTTLLAKTSDKMSAYLFVYFTNNTPEGEQLRYAVSMDGYNWQPLNNGQKVVNVDDVARWKCIRDPHILRGEDGKTFYMVMTDMRCSAGWSSNDGIVMMKSRDLVHWQMTAVDFPTVFPDMFTRESSQRVWAPQTIYDRAKGKYMVYYSLQYEGQELTIFRSYANKDFTSLTRPELMVDAGRDILDADIIETDTAYHMFLSGIWKLTAKSLDGPWSKLTEKRLQQTWMSAEGPGVFRRFDSEGRPADWCLMYDCYRNYEYQFCRSTDLEHFDLVARTETTGSFTPRHGTVMAITMTELQRLLKAFPSDGLTVEKLRKEAMPEGCTQHIVDIFTHDGKMQGMNPIFKHQYTCDPAPVVWDDTLWLFTGHDMPGSGYRIPEWSLFSTTDLKHWRQYPPILQARDIAWNRSRQAYAAHPVRRKVRLADGREQYKYYFYFSTNGQGIGVAVADRPEGPYTQPLDHPLIDNAMCPWATHSWRSIDPMVFIDDDDQAWIFWGNIVPYYAKLKDNMTELDGEVRRVELCERKTDNRHRGRYTWPFSEAPWVHKYGGRYYFTYATGFPEKLAYAVSESLEGPYEMKGLLAETAGQSDTTHPGIVEFPEGSGRWLLFTHDGSLPGGSGGTRAVTVYSLHHREDGTIEKVNLDSEGVWGETERTATPKLSAYLMVYHKDADHGLHMAYSEDGYQWTALNADRPIISGDTIAMQHGIRDPHILRGADGTFYMAMTDLHVFGQRDGKRTTEWERDGNRYAWGNNRGLVLMKSRDLVHWTHTEIDLTKLPAQPDMDWSEMGCAWAPETVCDEQKGQLLIHFTTRQGNGKNVIYCAYVDNDFTHFTTRPQLLLEAPERQYDVIDSDIQQVGDTYHLFYVSHEHGATIKHATSQHLTGPYKLDETYYDNERLGHEAPSCWKRLGSDTYVVMWDCYRKKPHNFGFVETRDFFTYTPIGYFDEPGGKMTRQGFAEQKHGSVTYITREELERLKKAFK